MMEAHGRTDMGEVVSLREYLMSRPPCHCEKGGSPYLCSDHNKVRSLDEVRRRVELPADCEPVRAE